MEANALTSTAYSRHGDHAACLPFSSLHNLRLYYIYYTLLVSLTCGYYRASRKAFWEWDDRRQHVIADVIIVIKSSRRHRPWGARQTMGCSDVRLHQEQRAGSNTEGTPGVQRRLETREVCPSWPTVRRPNQAAGTKVTGALAYYSSCVNYESVSFL